MNKYNKKTVPHPEFYITSFTKNLSLPYLLFIHGGPGFNCSTVEYLIEHNNIFRLLEYNIILYDQRNCGRSFKTTQTVLHQDNVKDVRLIINYLINSVKITIHGLIGHSYGAKVLFDYYNQSNTAYPGIFVSTANSVLIPRLNNLMLDLSYLKKTNPSEYNKALQNMDGLDLDKIWKITEKLAPLFEKNKERPYIYWANLGSYGLVKAIQKKLNLPINKDVFMSVRKDIYSNAANFSVAIDGLFVPTLWINGFHDFIMNGHEEIISNSTKTIFYQSAHYPHIEENDHFSILVSQFIKKCEVT